MDKEERVEIFLHTKETFQPREKAHHCFCCVWILSGGARPALVPCRRQEGVRLLTCCTLVALVDDFCNCSDTNRLRLHGSLTVSDGVDDA